MGGETEPVPGCRLLTGDCLEVLDQLAQTELAGAVATVFADPPYFLGKAPWDRKLPLEVVRTFHEKWLAVESQWLVYELSVSDCLAST
jgi:DNA modification methylase